MIINIKLVAFLFALLLIAAVGLFVAGRFFLFLLCLVLLGILCSHMKKHEKFYESELDEMFGKDDRFS